MGLTGEGLSLQSPPSPHLHCGCLQQSVEGQDVAHQPSYTGTGTAVGTPNQGQRVVCCCYCYFFYTHDALKK